MYLEQPEQLIRQLADLRGLSGREQEPGQASAQMLSAFVPDAAYRDGSVTAHLVRDPEKPVLLLCAHLDQVGFLVTDITDDGFLRIGCVGGIDHRLLLGQAVTVYGRRVIPGVISILPPHLLKGDQSVPEDAQLCVDLGYSDAEAVKQLVSRGDAVYYAAKCKTLANGKLTGSALDDRCGVAALILTAELLKDCTECCNVTFVCSGQEERSGRGAKIAALHEKADYAVAVDVTFGMAHGEDAAECQVLGKGPAVGISPVLSSELSDRMTACAEHAQIPYQTEVMTGTTGTDADSLALSAGGTAAGTLSIPLRYMHTPVEVIDPDDVVQTAQLLAALAKECGRA